MLYTVFPKSQSFGAPMICQLGVGLLAGLLREGPLKLILRWTLPWWNCTSFVQRLGSV